MWTWVAHWLGLDNASGPQYLAWSGVVGDIPLFTAAVVLLIRHNCHAPRCVRVAKHPGGDSKYYCKRHVPA